MPDDSSSMFDELLAEAVHEPPLFIPGTLLAEGRFVVSSLLGTGGMGAVYRAIDTRRDLNIAIKVLSRVEAAGIYALKQEFRSLSNVHHPNLVGLHELHSDRRTWFFTMDLVDGTNLSQVKWTIPLVRTVFGQIAGAIHAIHKQGKLHRDLKPSNVMITPAGRVVVLDFGLVSDQEPGGAGQTLADDGLSGTPAYMAPEQATGCVTQQSDWYAFGTMLYEALFGSPPFQERGVASLVRKREEPASPPPVPRGRVPEDLTELCMGLLERDASRRPGYREIIEALGTARTAGESVDDLVQDPFVGREPELHALEQALVETDQGRSAVVTVSGSPGIGKTRLVKRFLEMVRRELGGVVLSGRCPKWEHVPFRACDSLIDDLSRYLRTLPIERSAALLPRNMLVLTQLFPVLDRLPAVRTIKQRRALSREPSEIRRIGFAALRDLIGNIAAQEQLVVFVDDMHWSDLDGARLLASLVTQATGPDAPAVLLIIAFRTQDAGDALGLAAFLDRLASNPDLSIGNLELQDLSTTESRLLTARLLDGSREGIEDRIALEAGGNPLFIRQLVRHVLESGADSGLLDLDVVLTRRIAGLAPPERRTLAAICQTPRPVPLDLLSQVTDLPDSETPARNLVSAQLARFASGPTDSVTAFHDRVREVVLSGMDDGEHLFLHARSVEALEKMTDPDLVALTLHYLGCGREGDAAVCAAQAAQSAATMLAFEQAAAMYRLALDVGQWEEPEQVDLLIHLAEALALDRRSAEAGVQFLQAASLETDAAKRRALRLRAADQYLAGGWLKEGIGLLREIFADLGLDYDAICSSDLLALRKRLAERGLDITPRPESEIDPDRLARLDALHVAGRGLAWIKPQSVQIRFVLALEALEAGEPMRYACGLRTVARFDAQLDPDADEVYRVVRRICDNNPGLESDLIRPGLDTGMAIVRGRPWDQYEAACRTEELLLQNPTQDARVLAVARYHQAMGLHLQGEVHEIDRRCRGWLEDADERNDFFLASWLNAILAGQRIACGLPEVARAMCQRAIRLWSTVEDAKTPALSLTCDEVVNDCNIYEGNGSAWTQVKSSTQWFDDSPLGRIPFLVCHCRYMWAKAALASAQQARPGQDRREELLREAEASIATVAGPTGLGGRSFVLPHYRNLAMLLSAGLAASRDDGASAVAFLDRGLEKMSAAGSYSLRSAHARRAKGILLGGREGDDLVARAETDLRSMGVEDLARHARTVLPGFPS